MDAQVQLGDAARKDNRIAPSHVLVEIFGRDAISVRPSAGDCAGGGRNVSLL